jgi:hypothetical protein
MPVTRQEICDKLAAPLTAEENEAIKEACAYIDTQLSNFYTNGRTDTTYIRTSNVEECFSNLPFNRRKLYREEIVKIYEKLGWKLNKNTYEHFMFL